jgi:uncharacterized ferritin-like protein (DUF455 family)
MPENLYQAAQACLLNTRVTEKVDSAKTLWADYQSGDLTMEPLALPAVKEAGRPDLPVLVPPGKLARRKLTTAKGHAALIHAVAHIEFNAINLACDAASRFQGMPDAYYGDWLKVAAEEAHHFTLLQARLAQLGYTYGDFPAHNGLWEMAQRTADNLLYRMAVAPRMMEARGLDVTPGMIDRFRQVGDSQTAEILQIILSDEIGHVEVGSRWFRYLCEQQGLDAEKQYLQIIRTEFRHMVRCPLHKAARLAAGFTEYELAQLEALCDDAAT